METNLKRPANDGNDYQENKRTRTTKVQLRFLLASRMLFEIVSILNDNDELFLRRCWRDYRSTRKEYSNVKIEI